MIKKVAFIGHRVTDMERAKKFYGELLGLPLTAEHEGKWAEFDTPDGKSIALETFSPEEEPKAREYAKRAEKTLKRKILLQADPRHISSPSIKEGNKPVAPRLAVLLGPYHSRTEARGDKSLVHSSYKPFLYRTFESRAHGRIEVRDAGGKLVAKAMDYVGVRPTERHSLLRARKIMKSYSSWHKPGVWLTPVKSC